jgi:DNA polymerase-3 subunit alpha (Gram-positive type)
MLDLIRYGLENSKAFKIMEFVRKNKKGKPLPDDMVAAMKEKNVPDWYIDSLRKIKYMFPKAHAAAYVMSAIRLGWYKVHMPLAFYCAMFTVAPGGFDAEIVMKGKRAVVDTIADIEKRKKSRDSTVTQKEEGMIPTLQLVNECFARNIKFLKVDLKKSDAFAFLPENGAIRMPFSSLGGLGETAAQNIITEREKEPFFSVEDLRIRAGLTKSVIEILRRNGVLDNLSETDQITISF